MDAPKARGSIKPGVTVMIGGEEYTCPELDFGAIRNMESQVERHQVRDASGQVTSRFDIHQLLSYVLLESLRRNYENVNALWLNETLLGSEIEAACEAELQIMLNSGMKMAEQAKPGEAPAVTG
jgi:hypothetical protein